MSETRARRRIRKAVELYGYELVSLDYEPIGPGAEKSGPEGGWYGEITFPDGRQPDGNKGEGRESQIMGYGVEDTLDWIDQFVKPVDPCGHKWTSENAVARLRAQVQTHPPGCRYHLTYSLPWFRVGAAMRGGRNER